MFKALSSQQYSAQYMICCMKCLSLEFVKVTYTALFEYLIILPYYDFNMLTNRHLLQTMTVKLQCFLQHLFFSFSVMSHEIIWPLMVEHTHCLAWRSRLSLVINFHGVIEEKSRAYALTEFLWAKAFLRVTVLMHHSSSVAPTTTCSFQRVQVCMFHQKLGKLSQMVLTFSWLSKSVLTFLGFFFKGALNK